MRMTTGGVGVSPAPRRIIAFWDSDLSVSCYNEGCNRHFTACSLQLFMMLFD